MILSQEFLRNIRNTFGDDGSDWLERLPDIITICERRWSLEVSPPFANLSYNYVAPARRSDGTDLVLKMGVPRPELEREIEALRAYDGRGSVRLLDTEPDQGVLLLERLKQGRMLSDLWPGNDDEATIIAAGVMRQLWRPVTPHHNFKKIEKCFEGLARLRFEFNGGCGPFPVRLVETAESLYKDLSQSMGEPVLLHGDLHHFNILSAAREPWLAIDPKGVVGETAYDVGALLRNPVPDVFERSDLDHILDRRVAILAEILDLDRRRFLGWGVAQAVLSAWWSYKDNDSKWRDVLLVADQLTKLLTFL
jgi:streptomycin 6-kinase